MQTTGTEWRPRRTDPGSETAGESGTSPWSRQRGGASSLLELLRMAAEYGGDLLAERVLEVLDRGEVEHLGETGAAGETTGNGDEAVGRSRGAKRSRQSHQRKVARFRRVPDLD